MFKLWLFIIFIFHIHDSSCFLDDLDHAGRLLWNVYLMLDEISQKNISNAEKFEHIFSNATVGNKQIKDEIHKIFGKLDEIESSIQKYNLRKISDSLQLLSVKAIQRSRVSRLELCITSIDRSYGEFEKYINGKTENSDDVLDELLGRISVDIEGDITLIRKLIIEENASHQKNIIEAITDDAVRLREKMCGYPQLMSTTLAELLNMVLIAELKTNLMLLIAHIHQYWEENGWHEMISFTGLQFKKHFTSYVNVFALNMNATDDLYFRACDPVNGIWSRDQNFFELDTVETKIFQYDPNKSESTRCSDEWFKEQKKYVSMQYHPRTTCEHTLTGCSDLGAIKFCVLRSDLSRFHYVNSTKLGSLGTDFKCPKDDGFIGQHRGACACDCTGDGNKISLSLMQSRVRSNWVITGLRFFRKNGVLHIQPKEGILEGNGYISPEIERWIPIPNNTVPHTIDSDSRLFFIDNLRLPPHHLLTGVKFNEVLRGSVSGFAIEIFGTPFDYKSGKCLPSRGLQKSVKALNSDGGTSIEFSKVPSNYARVQHTPNPVASGYLSLERLDLSADIGRATIPFFDATAIVTNNPPSVLGGIGIFHKKADGYAGFISLRVFGIKYTQYLLDFQHEAIINGTVVFDHPRHD